MKQRLKNLMAGVLIGVTLTSGAVFAKQISETAELFYNNIKIYINGGEIVPKDATGNVVEPFIMNGTTYLPVRAISNALGKDVEWDGATQSVYIGKKDQTKPDNYLDRIQYNDVVYGKWYSNLWRINGKIIDTNNNEYLSGMLFYNDAGNDIYNIDDDADNVDIKISYPLNSKYTKLTGKIVLPKDIRTNELDREKLKNNNVNVYFYGDNKLIYKATSVSQTMPFAFDLNIKGVNNLVIKLGMGSDTYVALTDLALYK